MSYIVLPQKLMDAVKTVLFDQKIKVRLSEFEITTFGSQGRRQGILYRVSFQRK